MNEAKPAWKTTEAYLAGAVTVFTCDYLTNVADSWQARAAGLIALGGIAIAYLKYRTAAKGGAK